MKERPQGFAYALYASDDNQKPRAGYVNLGSADEKAAAGGVLPLNQWSHVAVVFHGYILFAT